jgi:hypothetical protein
VNWLGQSRGFDGRPDRAQVDAALDRIAKRVVAQRDWHEERPRMNATASSH